MSKSEEKKKKPKQKRTTEEEVPSPSSKKKRNRKGKGKKAAEEVIVASTDHLVEEIIEKECPLKKSKRKRKLILSEKYEDITPLAKDIQQNEVDPLSVAVKIGKEAVVKTNVSH